MSEQRFTIEPVGVIRSELTSRAAAPMQGDEGAPDAWLDLEVRLAPALDGIQIGDELLVLTWLHQAQRDVLSSPSA